MSVNPGESTSELWARWQGHVINSVFPLGRYLGSSDHGGVFLTESAARFPSAVAIKLVPTNRALAESQLPRWRRASALAHPHLLRLWEWGGCQLDGSPHLYVVMEYADQTLAQLLLHRALTDNEAREMLPPILDALAFLHGRNLVQGQVKPANILVVGDQLKLASDTIRPVSEGTMGANTPRIYDPPEASRGSSSAAGDIWGLGVSLFEALTRRRPSGVGESREGAVLPADFPAAFRDVVARCLSARPQDRPSTSELMAWAHGESSGSPAPATVPPAAPAPTGPEAAETAPTRPGSTQVVPEPVRPEPSASMAQSPKPQTARRVVLAAVLILALGWAGVRAFRTARTELPPPPPVPAHVASGSRAPAVHVPAPATVAVRAPAPAVPPLTAAPDITATRPSLHQVIPDVPRSARRTIRGHIKVWVRVRVGPDGSVTTAVADRTGPSRYFLRLAIEAAKQWTFPAADAPPARLMQVRFDFSRDGTTGHAVTLH